jgi:tetratricopeptide (TPR) repeat protein
MKRGLLLAALLCVASGSAYAQNRWAEPYRAGIKLFDAGKYAEAAAQLERAVAADPRDASQKLDEGVYRVEYFPHYYLALAYAELKQWQKAKENLEKARGTVPRQPRPQQARFKDAEGLIARGLTPEPAADPRKKAFDADADAALASLTRQKYQQAIGEFDAIRSKYADLFASSDLAAKRDEAVKGYAGQLWDEGRQLLQQNKLNEAKAKLQQSDGVLGGQKATTDLLAEIKRREDDYQRLKAGAQQDTTNKNYSGARDKYQQAQTADPEQFAADNLGPKLTEVIALARIPTGRGTVVDNKPPPPGIDPNVLEGQRQALRAKDFIAQKKYAEADRAWASALESDSKNQEAAEAVEKARKFKALRDQSARMERSKNKAGADQTLREAQTLDPGRFTAEGLDKKLTPPVDRVRDAMARGLLALLNGKASDSVSILEPIASTDPAAQLHAYLGVAYATQALSAPKSEDRTRLQNKAIEQFKLAKSAQPDYQLSTRIVSPAILSIYQASR